MELGHLSQGINGVVVTWIVAMARAPKFKSIRRGFNSPLMQLFLLPFLELPPLSTPHGVLFVVGIDL